MKGTRTKKMLKPLSPTLRERKRYLAFEIISEEGVSGFKEVSRTIWENSLSFSGTKGCSDAGIWILPDMYNEQTQRGLIRVNHKHVDSLRASLLMVQNINGTNCLVRTVGVSGILKKARKRYLNA